MSNKTNSRRSMGRPKLAKNEAKAKIVQCRLNEDDFRLVTKAATANQLTTSDWIRETLRQEAEVFMFGHTLHDAMKIVLQNKTGQTATTSELCDEISCRGLYSRTDGGIVKDMQIEARAKKYPSLFSLSGGQVKLT